MKKIRFLIAGLVALTMLSGCTAKEDKSVGIIGGADGPTAVVVGEESVVIEGENEAGEEEIAFEYEDGSYETNVYDKNGNLVMWKYYNPDKTVGSYQTYEYDENGFNTKIAYYNGDGTLSVYDIWAYDKDGNITESASYGADGTVSSRMTFEYDKNGNCIKDTAYGEDGKVSVYSVSTFSDDNRLIREDSYTGSDELIATNEYEYDENGYLCKLTTSTPAGIASVGVYENDADGNVISEKWYDGEGNELDYSTPQMP